MTAGGHHEIIHLSLPGRGRPFAPEVTALLAQNVEVELHPKGHLCSHRERLGGEPSVEEWGALFQYFPFADDLQFARYYLRAEESGLLQEPGRLIEAYSTRKRREEWLYLAAAPEVLANLYIEKNIPIKYLQMAGAIDHELLERLYGVLRPEWLKSNIAREIFSMWIDLSPELARKALQALEEEKALWNSTPGVEFHNSTSRPANPAAMSRKLKTVIEGFRYPKIEAMRRAASEKIAAIGVEFHISYDEAFEKRSIELKANLNNIADWDKLASRLGEAAKRGAAGELFQFLEEIHGIK